MAQIRTVYIHSQLGSIHWSACSPNHIRVYSSCDFVSNSILAFLWVKCVRMQWLIGCKLRDIEKYLNSFYIVETLMAHYAPGIYAIFVYSGWETALRTRLSFRRGFRKDNFIQPLHNTNVLCITDMMRLVGCPVRFLLIELERKHLKPFDSHEKLHSCTRQSYVRSSGREHRSRVFNGIA